MILVYYILYGLIDLGRGFIISICSVDILIIIINLKNKIIFKIVIEMFLYKEIIIKIIFLNVE